ncbi:hypothetical protein HPB49_019014 [Dermacentor silvarum]|uniref:Uncharacterized protein n=1 Tax=Dermacentor silvarum TaxID=543639 RepID=A0ACB8DFB5_DERSI|nr:hypothetical protein HPB49_019014 [Dermacentor silvarum]
MAVPEVDPSVRPAPSPWRQLFMLVWKNVYVKRLCRRYTTTLLEIVLMVVLLLGIQESSVVREPLIRKGDTIFSPIHPTTFWNTQPDMVQVNQVLYAPADNKYLSRLTREAMKMLSVPDVMGVHSNKELVAAMMRQNRTPVHTVGLYYGNVNPGDKDSVPISLRITFFGGSLPLDVLDGIPAAEKRAAVQGAMLGKLPGFDPDGDDCDIFFERLVCFVAANDIAEDKRSQVLLTSIGEKAYVTLRSLLLPKTPTKYRFNQRKQEPHESIGDFIGLKQLAAMCEYGTFLEQALRDHLIAGLSSDSIRCRLLATPDAELTWDRTCIIVAAMESATRGTQEIVATLSTGTPVDSDVHWHKETAAGQRQAPGGEDTPRVPFRKRLHQRAHKRLRCVIVAVGGTIL